MLAVYLPLQILSLQWCQSDCTNPQAVFDRFRMKKSPKINWEIKIPQVNDIQWTTTKIEHGLISSGFWSRSWTKEISSSEPVPQAACDRSGTLVTPITPSFCLAASCEVPRKHRRSRTLHSLRQNMEAGHGSLEVRLRPEWLSKMGWSSGKWSIFSIGKMDPLGVGWNHWRWNKLEKFETILWYDHPNLPICLGVDHPGRACCSTCQSSASCTTGEATCKWVSEGWEKR